MRRIKKIFKSLQSGKVPPRREKICFVHLPKCAGQSLVATLKASYPHFSVQSTNLGAAIQSFDAFYESLVSSAWQRELEWSRYRQSLLQLYLGTGIPFVYGHHPCGTEILEVHRHEYRFITVMREPVSRFISNYIYDRTGPRKEAYYSDLEPEQELMNFLESEQAVFMANTQLMMLGGFLGVEENLQRNYERAIANLEQYAIVGFTEDLASLSAKFEKNLNIHLSIPKINTGSGWQKEGFDYKSLFDEEVRNRISRLAELEIQLYQLAYARYGEDSISE